MKHIQLTKGHTTIVDDNKFIWLSSFNWYAQGPQHRPARRLLDPSRQLIYMYHQILDVDPRELTAAGYVVDHIDRNALNNQLENLRIVKHITNSLNSLRSINRLGVGRDNTHNTWKAYIDRPYKNRVNIGTFKTRDEAQDAVNTWRGGIDV